MLNETFSKPYTQSGEFAGNVASRFVKIEATIRLLLNNQFTEL